MKLRRSKSPPEHLTPDKLQRRMAGLATPDLPAWIEQCLVQIGRSMIEFQRTGEQYHLDEAEFAANTCQSLVEEYKRRNT